MSDLEILEGPGPFVTMTTDDQTVDPRVGSMIDELLAFMKEEEEEKERERLLEEEKEEERERLEEIKGRLEDARDDARERLELKEEEDADEEARETARLEEEEEAREIARLEELLKEEKEKWEKKWEEKWEEEEEEEEGRSFTRSATTPMHSGIAKLLSFSSSKIRFINASNTPVTIMYTHDLVSVMMKSCGIETNVGASGVGVKLDVVREMESQKEVKAVLTLAPGKKQEVLYAPKRILLSVCTLREGALNLLYSNLKLKNGSIHTIEQSDVDYVLAEEDVAKLKMLAL